ncbi:MAG: hypothetical protein ABH817_01810 [archaeon]
MSIAKFSPRMARLLISPWEGKDQVLQSTRDYLDEQIRNGDWEKVPPIWLIPNFLINGFFRGLPSFLNGRTKDLTILLPTFKPLLIYNGHCRFRTALENELPVYAYILPTFGDPSLPESERLGNSYS